jgi:hypothetical protein
MEQSEVSEIKKDTKKPKRVMTEQQLEQLKNAREKAREVRLKLGDIKRKEKNIKKATLDNRIKELSIQEEKLKKPKKPPPSPSSSSESESEEEESEEEEELPKPSKAKKIPIKKKVNKMQDHELASTIAREEYRNRIMKETYKQAYASLFPTQLINPYNT